MELCASCGLPSAGTNQTCGLCGTPAELVTVRPDGRPGDPVCVTALRSARRLSVAEIALMATLAVMAVTVSISSVL